MQIIYDMYGRKIPLDQIAAADKLVVLKQKSGSDPWPVIEECFKIFEAYKPKHYQSHVFYLKDVRETRKDRTFASTKDPVTGGYLRYTIDIPMDVMRLIRAVYKPDELPMNKEFFLEFAKRFPKYKIAEKL